jgi:streptomycin 6-kinase
MTTALPIPDRLRSVVVTHFGEVGSDWMERLPDLVAQASRVWQLDVGAPFEPGGNVSWVAPVARADGTEAVLKVTCPGHRNLWEGKALAHWAGRGAVRLFESDEVNQTLLVERCVPGMTGDELDAATGNEVVASVLAELHAIDLQDQHFEPLDMLVEHFRETMWEWFDRFEQPFDRGIVAQADELFTSLISSSADVVLLHGDLGPGNAVLSQRGWLGIDPYPFVGDRAFDVKQVLSLRDLRAAREEVTFFADRLDLDGQRVAGWTFACCVQRALECRSVENVVEQREYLARADQLASLALG